MRIGDKVWVKPDWALAETADRIEDGNYKWDKLGYYMNSEMIRKYCGKKVTLCSVACKDENGYVYKIEESPHYWCEQWFTDIDPNKHPEQFASPTETKAATYVADFDGSEENLTPAEEYFYSILPQLKAIVVEAYNKGAKK